MAIESDRWRRFSGLGEFGLFLVRILKAVVYRLDLFVHKSTFEPFLGSSSSSIVSLVAQ